MLELLSSKKLGSRYELTGDNFDNDENHNNGNLEIIIEILDLCFSYKNINRLFPSFIFFHYYKTQNEINDSH